LPRISVNGEAREIGAGRDVAAVLAALGIGAGPGLIVERNGAVVARDRYGDEPVADGDRLEIIRLMGGG
jgi:thiamine biosynthesis protein ThiS